MLLIRDFLLWAVVSLHVLGGAAAFRRLFPRESPWFGFVVPALALVLIANFVEHLVALPSLLWLLPLTTVFCLWHLLSPNLRWKGFGLPAGLFLAGFAFTLLLRALEPNIPGMRDGMVDLGMASSFCLGSKVPPPIAWDPDLPLVHYYTLSHYGLSVLTRLFGLDLGTGFNLSSALLSAFDCLIAAAVAWRISRQNVWVTILAPVLLEGASTGVTAYLFCTVRKFNPNEADDVFSGFDDPTNHSPLLKLLRDGCRHELMPPGAWSWLGSFHSTSAGLFLVMFFVWAMSEVLRRKAANWPWICLGAIPLLTIVSSTWALPLEGALLLGAGFWIWYYRIPPRSLRFVGLGVGLSLVLLAPTLWDFLTASTDAQLYWARPQCRVQLCEFLMLWWPIYLPFIALLFAWRTLPLMVKTVLIALPIVFLWSDYYTVANRYDWTGKFWCYLYSVGWIVLLPALFVRRGVGFRLLSLLLVISSLVSLLAWSRYTWRVNAWDVKDEFHLEGIGPFRWKPTLSALLDDLSRLHGKTILTGNAVEGYEGALAAFSGNRSYIAWYDFMDPVVIGSPWPGGAEQRYDEVNAFYEGKCADPLTFLRTRDIAAVVIYPDDNIGSNVIESLKQKLSPYYTYVDHQRGSVNAGIFFFHPEMPPGLASPAVEPVSPALPTAPPTTPK